MNAADRKAARKFVLRALREYAKAHRAMWVSTGAAISGACRASAFSHSYYLGALSLAHQAGLFTGDQYNRFHARDARIRGAKITRGIPIDQPQRTAA